VRGIGFVVSNLGTNRAAKGGTCSAFRNELCPGQLGTKPQRSLVSEHISPLSGTRKIVDVIFSYTNRNTDFTEKFFVRVDVTEEFPFLVTKMSPYYDR
jgi:PatG C-terminal